MRPGADLSLLSSPHVVHDVLCEITDASGAWNDFATFLGADWRIGLTMRWDVDNIIQGTFTFVRSGEGVSLSPFMSGSAANNVGGSYNPALSPARLVRFSASATLPGAPPDWHELMVGKLDLIDIEGGVIEFRDLAAFLADVKIQNNGACNEGRGGTVHYFGAITDVANQIVAGNNVFIPGIGTPTVILDAPDDSVITDYPPCGVSVWEAIRTLVLQFNGREIRFTYHGTDTFACRIYDPRPAPTPVATFGPDDYLRVPRMQFGDAGIGNVIRVYWQNKDTGVVRYAVAEDLDSITNFGTRYVEIGEGSTNEIDTQEEAQALADAVLADLATPRYDHDIETFLFWAAELGDTYTLLPNGVHYDEAQAASVVGIEHKFENGTGKTTLMMRGTPQGAYLRWLHAKRGPFPPNTLGPLPLILASGGEATPLGGGITRDGMTWVRGAWVPFCSEIRVYGISSETAPVLIPDNYMGRICWTLNRPDGDVGRDENLVFWVPIASWANWYRKVPIRGFGGAGKGHVPGPLQICPGKPGELGDIHAVDDGAAPAVPTDFVVTPIGGGFSVNFTRGDPSATHLIWRNGVPVKEILPGDAVPWLDTGHPSSLAFSYGVHAIDPVTMRSSDFAAPPGITQEPPQTTAPAPQWAVGYPFPHTDDVTYNNTGRAGCVFGWNGFDGSMGIAIEVMIIPGIRTDNFILSPIGSNWQTLVAFAPGDHTSGTYISTFEPAGSQMYARIRNGPGGTDPSNLYSATAVAEWNFTPTVGPTTGGGGGVLPAPWTV